MAKTLHSKAQSQVGRLITLPWSGSHDFVYRKCTLMTHTLLGGLNLGLRLQGPEWSCIVIDSGGQC